MPCPLLCLSAGIALDPAPPMDPDTFQNAWAVLDVVMDEVVRMRIGGGAKVARDPAAFVSRMGEQRVLTIASGGQGTTQKFYMYAGAEGGQGTFLVEMVVDVPGDTAHTVVKTDALHHGDAFSVFVAGLVSSFTGFQGEW